jgi:predicted TIM-barrel fold metal-dependent hydrolase
MNGSANAQAERPFVAVTADSHIGPRLKEDLRSYCPRNELDEYDAFVAASYESRENNFGSLLFDGERRIEQNAVGGHYDMHARLRDMDRDGVAAEVLFHGSQNQEAFPFIPDTGIALFYNPTGSRRELDLVAIGQRMYNEWLADVCSIEPERHVGLAHLPLWDLEASIRELEWAKSVGLRGVNFPAPRSGLSDYDDPVWEPFWDVCEQLEMPLSTHAGAASASGSSPDKFLILVCEDGGWLSRRALPRMIFSGVFERHPRLNLIFTELTEQPSTWWPQTMKQFEAAYVRKGWQVADLAPKPPSIYMRSNVFIGASFLHRAPSEAVEALAEGYSDNMMWGSDYPHIEGCYIHPADGDESTVKLSLRQVFRGLPVEPSRRMVGENAVRVYGLSGDALGKVASRIDALTPSSIAEPVGALPAHWSSSD